MAMTDKAAHIIAEKTIQKYKSANYNALIMYFDEFMENNRFNVFGCGDEEELANCMVQCLVDYLGDDFEAQMKDIIKKVKAGRKEKKKNGK